MVITVNNKKILTYLLTYLLT